MQEKISKYYFIYKDIKKDILENIYSVGELIPAEPFLQKKYTTSRVTIRKAIQLLVDEGHLNRIHGVGTMVISKKEILQLQTLISFSEETEKAANHSELLFFDNNCIASPIISSKLNIPNKTIVTVHEKIRYSNNTAIGFQRVYTPNFINLTYEELNDPNSSLYKLFTNKGHEVTLADETIESIVSDTQISSFLKIPNKSPLLYVQRITKDKSDSIIEYAEIFSRGDRYRYHIKLKVE